MSWNIEEGPDALDKYEWGAKSSEEEQVMTDTVAPGDLNLRPEDMDMVPTLAPATTGIQHGQQDWSYQNAPDSEGWYSFNSIVED